MNDVESCVVALVEWKLKNSWYYPLEEIEWLDLVLLLDCLQSEYLVPIVAGFEAEYEMKYLECRSVILPVVLVSQHARCLVKALLGDFHQHLSHCLKHPFQVVVAGCDLKHLSHFDQYCPRILKYNNKWVDHRTFGLSMQVYGSILPHVINIMSEAVMVDQHKKKELRLVPQETWSRHIVRVDTAELLQDPDLVPHDNSNLFAEKRYGNRLDSMDMTCRFWYLIVANFKDSRFEVFCPNEQVAAIKNDAETVIWNFRRTFKIAYEDSTTVHFFDMGIAYCSVSKTKNLNDSGVFIMMLIQKYDGNTHLYFKSVFKIKDNDAVFQLLFCLASTP